MSGLTAAAGVEMATRRVPPRRAFAGAVAAVELDKDEPHARDTRCQRKSCRAYAGPEIGDAMARTPRRSRGEQHRIVPGTMAAARLPKLQPAAEKRVVAKMISRFTHRRAIRG